MFLIIEAPQLSSERVVTLPDESGTVDQLRELVGAEFGIAATGEIMLSFAGASLLSGTSLATYGVTEGVTISMSQRKMTLSDVPANLGPTGLIQLGVDQPHILQQLLARDAEMGILVQQRDEAKLRLLIMQRGMRGHKAIFERDREMDRLSRNPDDPENQRRIEELIRQETIDNAHSFAMENNPEAFAQVPMLYVPVTINNHAIKAFVDSGAQMTIMSRDCAEKCGLLRLMDTRYSGVASGVGTGKILGRVHLVQMKLGNSFFQVSLTILEDNKVDCLFGLDTLKRYRCCIDLHKNVLRMLDGSGGPEEVPFLGESEAPKSSFANDDDMDTTSSSSSSSSSSASAGGASAGGASAGATNPIEAIVALCGCSAEDAEAALAQTSGNVDEAAALLLAAQS